MSKPNTGLWIVNELLENWRYFTGRKAPIPHLWVKGSSPLFLVLGENASGKSFFRRCVQASANKHTSIREVIHLSMEGRAGANFIGAMKGFVYGDENFRSTGENSANTMRSAIRTCRAREHSHLLYWDEPDIGMSEGAAAGAGVVIAEFVADLPDHTRGVFITTHSRPMVRQLLVAKPHYIHLGVPPAQAPQSLEEWLEREVSPISPEELAEASHARFTAIQEILDGKRRKKTRSTQTSRKHASRRR